MPQYLNIQTQIVSADHLVRALRDLGLYDVAFYETAQPLEGWGGDLPRNAAQIIIRKKYLGTASNDIGFKQGPDGRFVAIISDYDKRRFDVAWLNRLTQRYAYHVALEMLKEKDFNLIEESEKDDQTIHLTLRRMATS